MGAAFSVAILGIYLLVVAPAPGDPDADAADADPHFARVLAFGAPFTATSMIGFIPVAGIIVRNSILLVDFIQRRRQEGAGLRDASLEAGAVRFKPILLIAAAAMIGAAFIMTDPIFQGLASLLCSASHLRRRLPC